MESLEFFDGEYERILNEIEKPNRAHARRVLHCLAVAIRPLRVAELAEVLTVDPDDAERVPKLNVDWRWKDPEQAILVACSSLIAIVEDGESRVVQFSHYSVREFLTSSRLAIASGEVSGFHIDLAHAHTTLAQACLGALLRITDDVDGYTPEDHPLARYAAQHWTTHTQFGDVSLRLQRGLEYFFDPDKPHFGVWRKLYDIDTKPAFGTNLYLFVMRNFHKSAGAPLYYAALCGFRNLVKHLIIKYPQDVNASGGHFLRPLAAALAGHHFQIADLLRHHGADPHFQGNDERTLLHCAAYYGDLEVVQKLIEYNADIDAKDLKGRTPFYNASGGHYFKDFSVLLLLLEHGADLNARAVDDSTPLHNASFCGSLEIVRLLLKRGADLKAEDKRGRTALQIAEERGKDEVMKLLLEHRARAAEESHDG